MAKVPEFDTVTTKEAPLVAQVSSIASPDLLDAGAVEAGKLAQSIVAAGSGVDAVAYHMHNRELHDALFTAESADKQAYIAYEADVRTKRQGASAKGVTNDTAAWWKDRITKSAEGMSEEQRRLYTQRAMPTQIQSLHSVSMYEAHQSELAHDASWNADKANTINLAAATPTPGIVKTSVTELQRFNAYQAVRKGWSPEVLQAQNSTDITNLHKQAIQTIARESPTLAEAYYKEHEQEIAGSQRAEIGEFAKKATAAKIGSDAAEEQWALNGPQNDTDASNVDVMEKNIRTALKNDPYARDVALKNLHELNATRSTAVKSRDSQRTATVNSMLMSGTPLAAVQQTPAWAALDGTEQRKILEHEETRDAVRENRLAAKESRAYTASLRKAHEKEVAGTEARMRLSDPDVLVGMTRNEVINMRTTLGDQNTQNLLDKWDSFTKNGTLLSEAKLDNDQFNAFAMRAGIDVKSKDVDEQKRIIDTRDRVERILGAEQQAKKRPLTRDEKDKILQREIDNTVIQHNSFLRDQPMPLVALPYDKTPGAYVVVNGERVRLSSIPMEYRAELTAARRAKGLPTDERSLAEMWLKKQAAARKAKPAEIPAPPVETPYTGVP